MQFASTNDLNFIGYQVGEAALISAGYYEPPVDAVTGLQKYYIWTDTKWLAGETERAVTLPWGAKIMLTRVNTWAGKFTGKNGVNSLADLKTEALGQLVIQDVWKSNYDSLGLQLANAGKTWEQSLAQDPFLMDDGSWVKLSMSGVIAASHLVGAEATLNLLTSGKIVKDENGTSPLTYIKMFGGLSIPWGTNGDDTLIGNDFNNTFVTAGGKDKLTLGGGSDDLIVSNLTTHLTVADYKTAEDRILLTGAWSLAGVNISSDNAGTHLAFTSGQVIDLLGLSPQEKTLAGLNIYRQDIYQLSWDNSTETNALITDFEAGVDQFAAPSGAAYSNLEISESTSGWDWMTKSHAKDYAPEKAARISIAGAEKGYSISGVSADSLYNNLTKYTNGFTGASSGAKKNDGLQVDMSSAYGNALTGTSTSETFLNLGNQGVTADHPDWGGATINGNGGMDVFKISSSKISWYGNKDLTIGDFNLGGAAAERDVLDLTDLRGGGFTISAKEAANGSADILVQRSADLTQSTTIHLSGVSYASYTARDLTLNQILR
jgi:hypothetical protein